MKKYVYTAIFLLLVIMANVIEAKVYVLVDQVGYLPLARKYVFTTQQADSFYVIDCASQNIRYREKLELWKSNDPSTGFTIYRGDFTELKKQGKYFVKISTDDLSEEFSIRDSIYYDVYEKSLKGYYFQRCGTDLTAEFAGKFYHDKCHIADAFYHSSTDASGFKYTVGGWHDAGDYGKYVVNAGITVGTLLAAYELFPQCFEQDNLLIPESGNGVPDILDEVHYELNWLIKMQGPDGGVYCKVTTETFAPFIMPSESNSMRYIYQISSTATADFAAMMAQASRIYADFDETSSHEFLAVAKNAWDFLETHPSIVPPNGFTNPSGTKTGEYGDSNDSDERLWAAVELFLTTGASKYNNYYLEHYKETNSLIKPMWWQDVVSLAHLEYMFGNQDGINQNVQDEIRSSLISYCEQLINARNESGLQVLLSPGEYVWGSNSSVLNEAVLLILCYEETNDVKYIDTALDQLHYILGVNSHNMTFITGVAERSPLHPHHRPSEADGIEEPVPGLLVGGSNQYLQDQILQAHFNSSTPPALCYIDDVGSYSSNEIAINWNAPLVFVAGYFNGCKESGYIDSSKDLLPDRIELFQNYPNPFNNQTMIRFNLNTEQEVKLKIVNVKGERVYEKKFGEISPGIKLVKWDGKNDDGILLSSGIYLYYIEAEETTKMKKLVFLK